MGVFDGFKEAPGVHPPNGTLERYRLQEWLSFLTSEIHKGFIPLLYAGLAGRYVDTATPKLELRYGWIDKHSRAVNFCLASSSLSPMPICSL